MTEAPEQAAPGSTGSPFPPAILVVDDDETLASMLEVWTESLGYTATIAASGAAALRELDAGLCDLVLLDIDLGDMSGLEILRRIRGEMSLTRMPVIMLTARDSSDDVIEAFRCGANDYARKPVDLDVLQKRIETHLSLKRDDIKRIGSYRLGEKIGSGGMGIVYRATDERTGAPVALKVLHRAMTFDTESVERFLREARLAREIIHPGIVRVLEAGRFDECYYLAMELVEGDDLYQLTLRREVDPPGILLIIRQVALALGELHRRGIVHRDVKPENILVTAEGIARITDFGIAREIGGHGRFTEPGVGFGSIATAAPEQMIGEGDHRSDIYSLGATLFHAMAGRDAFSGAASPTLVLELKQKSSPHLHEFVKDIDPRISALAHRMMSPMPEGRPQGLDEIVAAIDEVLGG